MKNSFVAALLCCALTSTSFAAQDGYRVVYDGGSVPNVKAGNDVRLTIDQASIRFRKDKAELVAIPASAVTEISYGQDVHRRVGAAIGIGVFTLGVGALMALTKSKKHFIGLTWDDAGKKGGLAMQCDKNEYRGILSGIEGVTGKKAIDSTTLSVKN
jgi:opacity protein-like surface antigen